MTLEQIAAIALSVLAIGAGGVGAVQVAESPLQTAQPQWAEEVEGEINISVDRPVEPGENVTLTATYQDEPVPHAPVEVNGEHVGETDESGMIVVEIPESEEFEVEIEPDFEGELEIPLSIEEQTETEMSDDGEDYESEDQQITLSTLENVSANETVTILATVTDTPLYGAAVSVNGDTVGTTNENGSLEVFVPAGTEELELEAEYEYSGEYEVEFEAESDDQMEDGPASDPIALAVDGTFAGGEDVIITATSNGTAVENATVTINDERVGQTSANGTIAVTIPEDSEEVEIEVESDYGEAELEYEFEYEESDAGESEFEEADDDEEDDSDESEADDEEDSDEDEVEE